MGTNPTGSPHPQETWTGLFFWNTGDSIGTHQAKDTCLDLGTYQHAPEHQSVWELQRKRRWEKILSIPVWQAKSTLVPTARKDKGPPCSGP